jgi:hypothetical protein
MSRPVIEIIKDLQTAIDNPNTTKWQFRELFKEGLDLYPLTCNCTKCLSARAGHYVKSIDDYYKE